METISSEFIAIDKCRSCPVEHWPHTYVRVKGEPPRQATSLRWSLIRKSTRGYTWKSKPGKWPEGCFTAAFNRQFSGDCSRDRATNPRV